MIPDIMTNKIIQTVIKELFNRCRKLNIFLAFMKQYFFSVPKEVRLNSTHCLMMKIHSKGELQQIAVNHSVDIDYKCFLKIYINCSKEPCSFLTIDTTLPAENPMRFKKNFLDYRI